MRALILEDNADRRAAMSACLAASLPHLQFVSFHSSVDMIAFMQSEDLRDVVIISLDNDLDLLPGPDGTWIDPGEGVDIAEWLAEQPTPLCPLVIHTTNSVAGGRMIRMLRKANWTIGRVVPYGDLEWVGDEWFPKIKSLIDRLTRERSP